MNRRIVGAIAGSVLGALVGATIGGLVGRGIALFGDQTVQAVVPMAFCAVLGYAIGGASGCKGSLDRMGASRTGAASVVSGAVLLGSVVLGAALGSDTVAVFLGVVLAGLVLSGVFAAAVAGVGTPKTVQPVAQKNTSAAPDDVSSSPAEARAPKLAAARQTLVEAPVKEAAPPAERPRRTRPLRAGDAPDDT